MNVLVFGSRGQLGQCFKQISQHRPDRRYVFFDREEFDITDPFAYSSNALKNAKVLINCAAYTHVDAAETDQIQARNINTIGPGLMAKYCKDKDVSMIHFSTDYVYGPAVQPIREDHIIDPLNYYGQTKWQGEEAIRGSGASHLIFRTSWLYSAYGNNFVKTMLRLAEERNEIGVVDDQTGSPTYAMDLARAVDDLIHWSGKSRCAWHDTYNYANRGAITWFEFAREILKDREDVAVRPISSSSYPTPAKRPVYSVMDVNKFEEKSERSIRDWKAALKECMGELGN